MSRIRYQENPKYKDRLFRMLFSDRENIASLCSALGAEKYEADDIEEITTIDDVIYIKMKNDISFLLDSYMFLWEQQSTVNPNMPVRGLIYFAQLYASYFEKRGLNIYGRRLVNIPTPRYFIFYNGTENTDPVIRYRLSDAFIHKDDSSEFEWTAAMYNLNGESNANLLEACRPLKEYMCLVERIRYHQEEGMDRLKAIELAIDECIERGVMRDFLIKHRAEVRNMILTEYNEEVFVRGIREEGIEEGIVRGIEEGIVRGRAEGIEKGKSEGIEACIANLMNSLECSREEAMRMLKVDRD